MMGVSSSGGGLEAGHTFLGFQIAPPPPWEFSWSHYKSLYLHFNRILICTPPPPLDHFSWSHYKSLIPACFRGCRTTPDTPLSTGLHTMVNFTQYGKWYILPTIAVWDIDYNYQHNKYTISAMSLYTSSSLSINVHTILVSNPRTQCLYAAD